MRGLKAELPHVAFYQQAAFLTKSLKPSGSAAAGGGRGGQQGGGKGQGQGQGWRSRVGGWLGAARSWVTLGWL